MSLPPSTRVSPSGSRNSPVGQAGQGAARNPFGLHRRRRRARVRTAPTGRGCRRRRTGLADLRHARGVERRLAVPLVERRRLDLLTSGRAPTRLWRSSSPRQPISTAYRGLITSSMIASRSSNGMNADFIALMVNRCKVAPAVAERLDQAQHLLAHRGVAHQPVVGVDGDPEAAAGPADRTDARRCCRPHRSARWSSGTTRAEFACPATAPPAGRAGRCRRARIVDVVDDPHPVAEPVGAAERDRLVDGRQAERLARVNREAARCGLACTRRRRGAASAGSRPRRPRCRTRRRPCPGTGSPARRSPATGPAWRIAVTRQRTVIARPSALAAFSPSAKPASTASTTASSDSPPSMCSSGANRISAYTTLSAARSSTHSTATRYSASGVCITPTVCANGSR